MNDKDKFYRRHDRILQLITERPGITKTDLTLATNSIPYSERNQIINELVDDGIVEAQVTRTGKRPRVNYWPVDHLQSPSMQQAAQEALIESDAGKMSHDEILEFNDRRSAYNRILESMGCYPLKLLPHKT
jgi:hypothetical protein